MTRLLRRPLLGRTGWLLVGVEVSLATVLWFTVSATVRRSQLDVATHRLDALTELATHLAREEGDVAPALTDLAARNDVRLTWLTATGDIIDTADTTPDRETLPFRPEFQATLDGTEVVVAVRTGVTVPGETLFVARRDGRGGVLRMAQSVRALTAPARRIHAVVALATLLLVATTVVALVLATRRLERDADRLARPLRRFATGNLRQRRLVARGKELAPIAGAINEMSASLTAELGRLADRSAEHGAIIESVTSGLIAIDRAERVIRVNDAAARIFGFQPESARGRLVQEIVRDAGAQAFIEHALTHDPQGVEEIPLAGRARTITIRATPLRDAGDALVGVLLIIDDVTQLRRLESMRSDFAANVSHELRTPITNIKGYIETLIELGEDEREQQRQFLDVIRRNTERLEAIVEDILLLAKLESSERHASLLRERQSVESILAGVRRDAAKADEKDMTIRVEVEPDLEVVVAPQLLRQALSNLLANAINYAPAGTTIVLSGRHRGSEIELAVADEGPGIDPVHVPRLFERFYRVDAARSREVGGTGLGLAIVKHIALAHGGRADVESVVGEGSIFRILLPDEGRFAPTRDARLRDC